MPASSDDVEQLRQDHPGAAAHLPDPHPDAGPEDLTTQLLRQRRTALTRLRTAERGVLHPSWTANQLATAVIADLTDGHPVAMPPPLAGADKPTPVQEDTAASEIVVNRESAQVALAAAVASGLPFSTKAMTALYDLNHRLGGMFTFPASFTLPTGGES